jgi:hypothetical protein
MTVSEAAPSCRYSALGAWPADAAPPHYPFVAAPHSEFGNSPDPLRAAAFDQAIANAPVADLVCYALAPVAVHAEPAAAFRCEAPFQSVEVTGPGDLRFDFGVVSAGWLEFECDDLPEDVEFSISEYNVPAEVNAGAQCSVKTAKPVRVSGSTWRLVLNRDFYEGVRFGWLHARGARFPWSLRNLRLVCQARPANYLGGFSCDDPLLERIWETGATTVRLNLLRDHLGAILMERSDRHSWTGDAYVSQAAAMPVFGNFGLIRGNLDRTSGDTNGIEGYALYWIHALLDYVLCSGETAALRGYAGLIREKLRHAATVAEQHSAVTFCGHDDRTGACFEDTEIEANHRFFRLLALRTARATRAALPWIGGDPETAATCDEVEASLLARPLPAAGELGLHDGTEALLADALTESDVMSFLSREYGDPVTRVSYSPFNNFFILLGMSHARCHEAAMGLVRRCWGGMIELGATTFWESFRPEWADFMLPVDPPPNGTHGYTSLCHPWSGGVTRWLTDRVLGIRPTAPGYATFVFDPIPAGLKRVSGSVATPHGAIRAGFDGGAAWLEVPAGCRAAVRLNDGLHEFGSGRHEFATPVMDRAPVALSAPSPAYAASWLPDGDLASGLAKASGWIAFAATPDGGDIIQLPADTRVVTSENKPRGCPRRQHFPDVAEFSGALRTRVPQVVEQTFSVEVERPTGVPYALGIFCRDTAAEGIIQTVDVLDLERKTLIAPTRQLRNFENGVVLWLRYDRSVRIRICHCPGPDATLDGLLLAEA